MRLPLVVVSVPAAPIPVVPVPAVPDAPLVVVSVLAAPLLVVPLPVVPLPLAVLPAPVVPLAPGLCVVLLPLVEGDVVVSVEDEVPEPAVPDVPLPDEVCAIDTPPRASAAAAASAVRVFLLVVMYYSLSGNPVGNGLKEAGAKPAVSEPTFPPERHEVGICRHSL